MDYEKHAIIKEELLEDMLITTVSTKLELGEMSFAFRVSSTATRTPPYFCFPVIRYSILQKKLRNTVKLELRCELHQ